MWPHVVILDVLAIAVKVSNIRLQFVPGTVSDLSWSCVSQRFVVCPDGELSAFQKRLEVFYGQVHCQEFTVVRGVFSLGFVECFGEEAQGNPRALVMLLKNSTLSYVRGIGVEDKFCVWFGVSQHDGVRECLLGLLVVNYALLTPGLIDLQTPLKYNMVLKETFEKLKGEKTDKAFKTKNKVIYEHTSIEKYHGLLVDTQGHRLVDRETKKPATSDKAAEGTPTVFTIPAGTSYAELLQPFPDITRSGNLHREVRYLVRHHIETTGPPVISRARRLTPHLYKAAKEEFQRLISEGTCRPSSSPWASPLHMVQKADGSYRPCGDYRRLNTQTVPDRYAVLNVLDFKINVHGATVFSTIDLERAYYQIPVVPEGVQKTAVTRLSDSFEFTRMSFGLRKAA
ncbi:hypothetical protein AAG570_013259 [Ranatra chinensis]|uniref:Reverse transcriptase domain-containing protein n=1 Tax=Ranatra chinensis TaxID=642074 RepID=A0ABD0YG88_9HEMI